MRYVAYRMVTTGEVLAEVHDDDGERVARINGALDFGPDAGPGIFDLAECILAHHFGDGDVLDSQHVNAVAELLRREDVVAVLTSEQVGRVCR